MSIQPHIDFLRSRFSDAILSVHEFRGETTVSVCADRIVDIARALKTERGFDMLTDLSGVDHFHEAPRFEVNYHLYAMAERLHLRIKVRIPDTANEIDSVTPVWQTANWHERETFDMFGIRFRGHPNLKRILMWEGYPHHPLRKDFPLAGLPSDLPATADGAGRAETAPMAGGPFVPGTGQPSTVAREPRQYDTAAEQIVQITNPFRKESV